MKRKQCLCTKAGLRNWAVLLELIMTASELLNSRIVIGTHALASKGIKDSLNLWLRATPQANIAVGWGNAVANVDCSKSTKATSFFDP